MAIATQDVQIDGQPVSVTGSGNFTVVQPTGTNLHTVTDTGSTTAVTGNVTVVQPTGTNLHVVVDSGTITTADSKSNTANITQSTVTNVSSTILAANAARKRMVIFSASSNVRIAFSSTAASTSNFTYAITSNNVTIEDDVWTGAVQAITTGGSSVVTVTEMV